MRILFVFVWVAAFLGNFYLMFVMGNAHSSVLQDKAYCLFDPVGWIGYKLELWDKATSFIPLLWFWAGVLVLGLSLPKMRGSLSPFWALLLIPAAPGLSWWMGWR